jgi:hypothetical protein
MNNNIHKISHYCIFIPKKLVMAKIEKLKNEDITSKIKPLKPLMVKI